MCGILTTFLPPDPLGTRTQSSSPIEHARDDFHRLDSSIFLIFHTGAATQARDPPATIHTHPVAAKLESTNLATHKASAGTPATPSNGELAIFRG